jgi:hypothetical protein
MDVLGVDRDALFERCLSGGGIGQRLQRRFSAQGIGVGGIKFQSLIEVGEGLGDFVLPRGVACVLEGAPGGGRDAGLRR